MQIGKLIYYIIYCGQNPNLGLCPCLYYNAVSRKPVSDLDRPSQYIAHIGWGNWVKFCAIWKLTVKSLYCGCGINESFDNFLELEIGGKICPIFLRLVTLFSVDLEYLGVLLPINRGIG